MNTSNTNRPLIDAHIHLERGPYTTVWIDQFIQTAVKRNLSELYLLEHPHVYVQFPNSQFAFISAWNLYIWFPPARQKNPGDINPE